MYRSSEPAYVYFYNIVELIKGLPISFGTYSLMLDFFNLMMIYSTTIELETWGNKITKMFDMLEVQ